MLNGMNLRTEYKAIRVFDEALKSGGFDNPKAAEAYLIEMKRNVRAYNRKRAETLSDPHDRRFGHGEETYWERKRFPVYITTMEEAEKYFEATERIEMVHRPWDCSGQSFTAYHGIFEVNGRYILYHLVGRDI